MARVAHAEAVSAGSHANEVGGRMASREATANAIEPIISKLGAFRGVSMAKTHVFWKTHSAIGMATLQNTTQMSL